MAAPEAYPPKVEESVDTGEVSLAHISELYFKLIDFAKIDSETYDRLSAAGENVVLPTKRQIPDELVEQSPFEKITLYYYPKPWEQDELAALGELRVSCENKSLMPNNLVSVTEIELSPNLETGQISGQFIKFEVEADGQIKDYKARPLKQQTVMMLRGLSDQITN